MSKSVFWKEAIQCQGDIYIINQNPQALGPQTSGPARSLSPGEAVTNLIPFVSSETTLHKIKSILMYVILGKGR